MVTKTAKATKDETRPTLMATARTQQGRRPVTRMRHDGLVPGIVYGKATSPLSVAVNRRELIKFMRARAGEHGLVTLRIDTAPKPWEKPVLIKRIEHDPVDGSITHIDFHAIALTEHIRVRVPMVLTGDSVGVKQDHGVLEHFLREIEVDCLPTEIPKEFTYDISALKIGDAIHVKDLTVPAGVKITSDPEGVIASVLAPKEEKPEEVAAAVTEPEVIREKKPEEGEEAAEGKPEGKKAEPKEEKAQEKKDEKGK